MKRPAWILAALAFLAVVAVGIYLFSDHTRQLPSCTGKTIVAFGDSLVAGTGAPDGQGFVDDLAASTGVPIKNLGVPGDTTAQGLARIDDVLNAKPDIAIVLLGGNDALQKVSQATTATHLNSILSTLTGVRIKVVLVGVQGALLSDPYASMYKGLAKEYGAEYVPSILSGIIGHSDLMSDEVHPNAAGYQKVADKILPHLLAACGS